jgi:hypothetical protein
MIRSLLAPRVLNLLSLTGVGFLLASVSLSLVGDFAARENERDAIRTLELLRRSLGSGEVHASGSLREVAEVDPELVRQLENRHWLDGGERLLHHGYLFDRVGPADAPVLRAWPWRHGQTGRGAFVHRPDRGLLAHPNDEGLWNGPESAPSTEPGADWRALQ